MAVTQASLTRYLPADSTSTVAQLMYHVVYETAQGKADVCDSTAYEPLGVCMGVEDDGRLLIAGPGDRALVALSEDFEYSDSKIFCVDSTAKGAAKVTSPLPASTVTTLTASWAVGYITIPGTAKGASGLLAECVVAPMVIMTKAS